MSLPKENLDNKRFDELVKEAVSRIPIYAPDWTDHNIHDPGITFIELFAWLAEMQIYSLNKITERNYRKFLKLMGIPRLKPASPAKVDVTFTLLGNDPVDVPHGTLVAARDPLSGEDIIFETKDNLCVVPKIDRILLNTVSAIQCSGLKTKTFPSSGLPGCSIGLEHVPVLDKTLAVIVKEKINGVMRNVLWSKREDNKASRAVMDKLSELRERDEIEDPNGSEPENEHFIIDHGRVEDFDASKPGDRHFTVDPADGRVTFGDGLHGRIPPEGTITVYYQSGGGEYGNVKPHTITRVVDDQLARRVEVDNIKPAAGGKEAETLDKAKQRARNDLKKVCRAVTNEDYEYLASNVPGVARIKPLPGYHPGHDDKVPGIVTIIVVPKNLNIDSEVKVSPGLIKTVYSYLEKKRLLATELFVIPPEFEKVSVIANVVVHPKYVPKTVEDNVKKRLNKVLHPTTGGADGKGWDFGRPVYISQIYEMIDRVEGVDYVTGVTINGKKEDKKIPKHTLVYSGEHDISAEELRVR